MATSKVPVKYVLVPENVLRAAEELSICCNLRAEQRGVSANGFDVKPIKDFLEKLLVGNRIAVHFQGYSTETATMVVTLKGIYWDDEGCPKITCTGLKELRRTLGEEAVFEENGHFWGSFILAIALVHPGTPLYCGRDETARHFIATVRRWGLGKNQVGDARFVVRTRD